MSKNQLGTSMEDDLFELQSLGQLDPNNAQSTQKLFQKYQNKIQQLLLSLKKQKKNNEQLREQLKHLNQTLNTLLAKINISQKSKQDKEESKQQVTKRQLENQMKKTAALKKEVQSLKVRLKVYEVQKVGDLQDQIKAKDRIIEGLNQSVKLHEKISKKEMNADIYKQEEEAQLKIKALSQQILHLKKKNQQFRKSQEIQQKSMKFQQHQMNQIETRAKSQNKQSDSPSQTYTLLQLQNKKLKQTLQFSQNTRKNQEKSFKAQLQNTKMKHKAAQKAIQDCKEDIQRKEKELSRKDREIAVLMAKVKGQPLTEDAKKEDSLLIWTVPSTDCRRQLKGIKNMKPGAKKFDDSDILLKEEYRISSLTFRFFEQHIIQLVTEYQTADGKQKVNSFSLGAHYQSTRQAVLQLSQYEYIKEWQIYSGRWIEFIKIRTSKEQVLEIGNERNVLKCKRHVYDIKSYEKPISIFGVLEKKTVGQRQREVLVALGLVLKRKNIFALRSKSMAKMDTRGLSLASVNDKNV